MSFPRDGLRPVVLLAAAALACVLSGCASKNPLLDDAPAAAQQSAVHTEGPRGADRFLGIFRPYRINVQQGNFVSREMITPLKEAMQKQEGVTRDQVLFALGTPLLTDVFHADRWDYVFRLKKNTGEVISSRVSVFFKQNRLVNIEGDQLPTEQEYLSLIEGKTPTAR
ncbi:outer membrane protein assembly factor BamE [Noviherbaspirillum galbum]|nr:outer membrane protein assembly factor BamE [Noviherbaspirillum galbum]